MNLNDLQNNIDVQVLWATQVALLIDSLNFLIQSSYLAGEVVCAEIDLRKI